MKSIRFALGKLSPFGFIPKRYFLIFLNGFLLASIGYFYMEDSYEKQVFHAIAHKVGMNADPKLNNTKELIKQSLHVTHYLGEPRVNIFNKEDIQSVKSDFIHPVTFDLMAAKGSCGSYSFILSRLLDEMDIPNRIAQMKVGDDFGGHIIVEAKTEDGWVALDPSYDLFFTTPAGKLASFKDVSSNWDYFKNQVPAGYNMEYQYKDVRYTNWEKIPVIMPVIKQALNLAIGKEKADEFSLRSFTLRKFHILFLLALSIYIIVLAVSIKKYIAARSNALLMDPVMLFPKKSTIPVSLHPVA